MQRIKLLLIIPIFLTACTNPDKARNTLNSAGYTDIHTGGYDMFACGEGDVSATQFTAKNPKGQTVQGTVCCGLTKSCTIRF